MPYAGARRIGEKEWLAYRERRALHLADHPEYDAGWRRPTRQTAQRVWDLVAAHMRPKGRSVAGLRIGDFLLPNYPWVTLEDDASSAEQAMQALVVVLDVAVAAGEGSVVDHDEFESPEETSGALTANSIFDAVAARWSDHYRRAREQTPATCAYEMREETLKASWRDLLRNGFRVSALRDAVLNGCPGLYHVVYRKTQGYSIVLETDSRLTEYRRIVDADGVYERRRGGGHRRVLLPEDTIAPRPPQRKVAAEWAYNVVATGERSQQVISHLEGARLYFDTEAFRADLTLAESKRDELAAGADKSLISELKGRLVSMKAIRDDLDDLEAAGRGPAGLPTGFPDVYNHHGAAQYLKIRSGFYKLMNRRYQAAHFWPTEVTTRDIRADAASAREYTDLGEIVIWLSSSSRGRWFRAPTDFDPDWIGDRMPLVSADVSASQIQILAVFLGLEGLESAVSQRSLKTFLAERAWRRSQDPGDDFNLPDGFSGPDDERLYAAVKTATMTHLYGSELGEVAFRLREPKSRATYGPGLGTKQNIARLLHDPHLHLQGILGSDTTPGFLPACRELAKIAHDRDPYDGMRFVDPFDGAEVRWNPVRLQADPKRARWDVTQQRPRSVVGKRCVNSDGVQVYANLPSGSPNEAGDYRVDPQKLARLVAPCLTHMLDAMFASMVVEQLRALDVRTIVSVHDCWLVPADENDRLRQALKAVGEPWLRALGPVYDSLVGYLDGHETYGPWARDIRSKWQRRVQAGSWPEFLVGDDDLVELKPTVTPASADRHAGI